MIAALTVGLVGLVTTGWILMWGFDPWTLEGAWIYPLAAGLLLIAAYPAGRVRARAGWIIVTLTLGFFGLLIVLWAFFHDFPQTIESWGLLLIASLSLMGAASAARRTALTARGSRLGPLRESLAALMASRSGRVIATLTVWIGLIGGFTLSDQLRAIFTRRPHLDLVELGEIGAWTAAAIAGLILVIRVRRAAPTFRGVYSALLLTISVLQTCAVIATWSVIGVTGAYSSREVVHETERER